MGVGSERLGPIGLSLGSDRHILRRGDQLIGLRTTALHLIQLATHNRQLSAIYQQSPNANDRQDYLDRKRAFLKKRELGFKLTS